jgi:membrane protease YdiL (CAAX protease family)
MSKLTPVVGLLSAGGLAAAFGAVVLVISPALGVAVPATIRPFAQVALLGAVGLATAALGVMVFRPVVEGPEAAAAEAGSHRVLLTTTAFATLLAALIGNMVPILVLGLGDVRSLRTVPGFLAAALSVSGVLLTVGYLRFVRPGVISAADFGFDRNRLAPSLFNQLWLAHIAAGFGGWLLILLFSGIVQAVMRQVGVEQTQLRDFTWVRDLRPPEFGLVVLAGALIAPLAEEVFFRGLIFRLYLITRGPLVAYPLSSAVFALLHLNLPAFPPIVVLGMVLAWLYRSTGSLMPGVLAHGLNNGVAFIVLYSGRGLP